ncbi:unnamed protein product [Mucor hiemalis]
MTITCIWLGGDLHYHLSRQTYFSEDIIRFWFAELASAVKYLHLKRVVHRDIKPHNILMDDKGHVHLADFNIATHLHAHRPLTSNSGTGYYIAPEVYKGGGYNEAVDWWSLGVTLYECIYQKRPFEYETTEELQAAIRRGHVNYPTKDRQVSGECLAVIQGFLEVNPNKRLGHGDTGWAALVRHPFFRPINWSKLESKSITPPFQPATENNFDLTYDLEELLLEESPLTAHTVRRPNKLNKKDAADPVASKRDRDLSLIEEKFKYFDFTIFEKYEGFKDPVTMTVGDPPNWVKPAFEGAEQGDILPIKKIMTESNQHENFDNIDSHFILDNSWRGPNKSASTSNISTITTATSPIGKYDQDQNWKRSSMGAIKFNNSNHNLSSSPSTITHQESSASLSEEYALSLQGIRKKQSTKSFRERRERDRKSIQTVQIT